MNSGSFRYRCPACCRECAVKYYLELVPFIFVVLELKYVLKHHLYTELIIGYLLKRPREI